MRRSGGTERQAPLDRLSADPGLCATCVHLRLAASRRSVFVRCGLAAEDPAYARYPRLPVLACPGYHRAFPPEPESLEGDRG